jgi:predicted PhzF superfamily epimerase YddE/YHI9
LQQQGGSAKFTGAQGHHLHRSGRIDVELEFALNEKNESRLDGVWIVGQAVSVFETEMTL